MNDEYDCQVVECFGMPFLEFHYENLVDERTPEEKEFDELLKQFPDDSEFDEEEVKLFQSKYQINSNSGNDDKYKPF